MFRTRPLVAFAACALALVPSVASAHEGNPNYRSIVTGVSPAVPGVSVEVLNLDDSLRLVNRSPETVVVEGYSSEPYIRIKPDGTVELNRNSPATYLNDERDGSGTVPSNASKDAVPDWQPVDKTGRFQWHDHRIHYMGEGRPPAVREATVRTKAYDWRVPFRVGEAPAAIDGSLFWVPADDGGGVSPVAFAALGLLALGGAGAAVTVRRRRRTGDGDAAGVW